MIASSYTYWLRRKDAIQWPHMRLAVDTVFYSATSWLFIILVAALATAPDERRAPSLFEAASSTPELVP
jgi:hypothetical protein